MTLDLQGPKSHRWGQTPAGARLEVRRYGRWVTVEVDRWPIEDASPEEAAAVELVCRRAVARCFAYGRRAPIAAGGASTFWLVTAPGDDQAAVLDALLGIEAGDYWPAFEYVLLRPGSDLDT